MDNKKRRIGVFIAAISAFAVFGMFLASANANNFNRNDYEGTGVSVSSHNTVAPLSVEWGACGPIDLVIVLDDTGSMAGAINNIKAELPNIIATAYNASGGDLRMGYITFKDYVVVHNNLTTNISAVMDSINATFASGGAGGPEASDEAKNTAVNNLPAGTRTDAAGYTGTQIGDFTTPYRPEAVKIVVLITDAPPGGFNDIQDPADNVSMHTHAVMASSKGILMSDIFVPTGGDYAGQAAILKDDADTAGGVFLTVAANGSGTGDAINEIVAMCGAPGPTPPPASVPALTPIGLIALAGLLSVIAAVSIRATVSKKRK